MPKSRNREPRSEEDLELGGSPVRRTHTTAEHPAGSRAQLRISMRICSSGGTETNEPGLLSAETEKLAGARRRRG
jgi:hypothetical protein